MSPARHDPDSNNFSNRLRDHRRLVEHWESHDDTSPCVWAVNDQLLVSTSVSPHVDAWFKGQKIKVKHLTTLFAGLDKHDPTIDDVEIVELKLLAGRDIFSITTELRDQNFLEGKKNAVSPNHVAIPASNGDGCPKGPPSETPERSRHRFP